MARTWARLIPQGDFTSGLCATPIVCLFDPPPDGGGATTTVPVLSGTAAWVNKEYIDVLGREPGAAELDYWVAQADSGKVYPFGIKRTASLPKSSKPAAKENDFAVTADKHQ